MIGWTLKRIGTTEKALLRLAVFEIIEEKVVTCEDRLIELETQNKELKNTMLKDRADLENTKKRLEKERVTERKYASINVCKNIITPLDNFDLALKHTVTTSETEAVFQGFKMIKDQLLKALEDKKNNPSKTKNI